MPNLLQLPDAPPPLVEPLGLSVLLFEQPWIFMVLALVAGFIGSWWFKRKGRAGAGLAALGCGFALAGVLFLVAKLVVTDRERVALGMRELLRMTARVDADGLKKLLDPEAKLYYFKSPGGLDRDGIIGAVRSDLGQTYRIKDWGIQELQIARLSEGVMTTQMRVRVTPEAWNIPHVSWWSVEWKKSGDEWRVINIQPLVIQFYQGNPSGR
ncbi:MAG: DUF4440 domain-containing protein [Phycisphaerales bacterium]